MLQTKLDAFVTPSYGIKYAKKCQQLPPMESAHPPCRSILSMQACPHVVGELPAERTTASLLSYPPPTRSTKVAQCTLLTTAPSRAE